MGDRPLARGQAGATRAEAGGVGPDRVRLPDPPPSRPLPGSVPTPQRGTEQEAAFLSCKRHVPRETLSKRSLQRQCGRQTALAAGAGTLAKAISTPPSLDWSTSEPEAGLHWRFTLSRPGPGTSTKHLTVLRGQAAISDSCGPGHQRVVEDAPFDTGVEDPDQAVCQLTQRLAVRLAPGSSGKVYRTAQRCESAERSIFG